MKIIWLILTLLLSMPAEAATRSEKQKRIYAQAHPCPSTGKPIPHCPGYVIDHADPLCAGGRDIAANMQWQRLKESYRKDTRERAYCQCLKTTKGCTL